MSTAPGNGHKLQAASQYAIAAGLLVCLFASVVQIRANAQSPLLLRWGTRTLINLVGRTVVKEVVAGSMRAPRLARAVEMVLKTLDAVTDVAEILHLVQRWGGTDYEGSSAAISASANWDHVTGCQSCRRTFNSVFDGSAAARTLRIMLNVRAIPDRAEATISEVTAVVDGRRVAAVPSLTLVPGETIVIASTDLGERASHQVSLYYRVWRRNPRERDEFVQYIGRELDATLTIATVGADTATLSITFDTDRVTYETLDVARPASDSLWDLNLRFAPSWRHTLGLDKGV